MMYMTKKQGEAVVIAEIVKIHIVNTMAKQVRLGIQAPKNIKIHSLKKTMGEQTMSNEQYCNYLSISLLEQMGIPDPEENIISSVENKMASVVAEVKNLKKQILEAHV